jgi:two-component system invasion response regulator UvrY
MIRILIADDHTLVREGLKQILSDLPDMAVTDEASNGKEVLDKVRENDFDVILLDISLPGQSGVDILKQIKLIKPELPVLILSMYPEEQYAIRTLRAGASGYLTKDSVPDELIEALRTVSLGKRYITYTLAEKIAYELDVDAKKPLHERLSDREYQVMCMIASGKTVSQIAREISLSVKTISTHRARILKKMNMKNNAELTHDAIKHGLVD